MDFKNILFNLFISGITSGGVFLLFWNYFAQKSLEYYKNEFSKDLERLKADYTKSVSNFNIFNSKKHEIYSGLNSRLIEANNSLLSNFGLIRIPNFSHYTEDNVKLFLSETYFDIVRVDTLHLWHSNRASAIKELERLFESRRINSTKKNVIDFNIFFLENKLYISDELILIIEETFENMRLLLVNIEFLFEHRDIDIRDMIISLREEQVKYQENIKINVPKIIEQLRNELKN